MKGGGKKEKEGKYGIGKNEKDCTFLRSDREEKKREENPALS